MECLTQRKEEARKQVCVCEGQTGAKTSESMERSIINEKTRSRQNKSESEIERGRKAGLCCALLANNRRGKQRDRENKRRK